MIRIVFPRRECGQRNGRFGRNPKGRCLSIIIKAERARRARPCFTGTRANRAGASSRQAKNRAFAWRTAGEWGYSKDIQSGAGSIPTRRAYGTHRRVDESGQTDSGGRPDLDGFSTLNSGAAARSYANAYSGRIDGRPSERRRTRTCEARGARGGGRQGRVRREACPAGRNSYSAGSS